VRSTAAYAEIIFRVADDIRATMDDDISTKALWEALEKRYLIVHSSAELWVEPKGPEAYLYLASIWEPVVASAIEEYLGSLDVAWTSLDPARTKNANPKEWEGSNIRAP